MQPEQWSHIVSASVSPVVVISASALLCLALYNRLAAIITRLRAVQRERLAVQDRLDGLSPAELDRGPAKNSLCILESLADQTRHIRSRARLVRDSLLLLMGGIACLVICSLLAGAMVFWPQITPAAAIAFACGLLLVLAGVGCAALELTRALRPVELEADIVSRLTPGRVRAADRSPPQRSGAADGQPRPASEPKGSEQPR